MKFLGYFFFFFFFLPCIVSTPNRFFFLVKLYQTYSSTHLFQISCTECIFFSQGPRIIKEQLLKRRSNYVRVHLKASGELFPKVKIIAEQRVPKGDKKMIIGISFFFLLVGGVLGAIISCLHFHSSHRE